MVLNSTVISQTIVVIDTTPPVLTLPANVSQECAQPVDPASTGSASATDVCNGAAAVTFSDVFEPAAEEGCAGEIRRTWTVDGKTQLLSRACSTNTRMRL